MHVRAMLQPVHTAAFSQIRHGRGSLAGALEQLATHARRSHFRPGRLTGGLTPVGGRRVSQAREGVASDLQLEAHVGSSLFLLSGG